MPRYFFDTYDNDELTADEMGVVCASREEVRRAAIGVLPHMAMDALPDGRRHEFKVEARDEGGRRIFRAILRLESDWLDEG